MSNLLTESEPLTMHTAILDNKHIAWTNETKFHIELGKGIKGSYKPRYTITGNLGQALFYYRALNVGYSYKKRLVMNGKVLAKYQS